MQELPCWLVRVRKVTNRKASEEDRHAQSSHRHLHCGALLSKKVLYGLLVRCVLVQIVLAGTVPERVAGRNDLEAAYVTALLTHFPCHRRHYRTAMAIAVGVGGEEIMQSSTQMS